MAAASGNLFIASGTLRSDALQAVVPLLHKLTPAGVLSQVYAFNAGDVEGAVYNFGGIAVDGAGNVYVADFQNERIRKVTPAGAVTTFAGSVAGYLDGANLSCMFYSPSGIAINNITGDLIICDRDNNKIRKIASGMVSTLAGSANGYLNGTGTSAMFAQPYGVAVNQITGEIFVADRMNSVIRKITPTGVVSTYAGTTAGYSDGPLSTAQFDNPSGITIDSTGNLYIADAANYKVRKISSSGIVSTIAGSGQGYADGVGAAAMFDGIFGIVVDSAGTNLYVADYYNNKIRKIDIRKLSTTGIIKGEPLSANLTVWPNPSNGTFNICNYASPSSRQAQLDMYDAQGQKVFSQRMDTVDSKIETPSLPDGIYFLRLQTHEDSVNLKILISKY